MRKLPRAADQCRPRQKEAPEESERLKSRGMEEEERRHQDNPAAAIVCFPRAGEQGSGESQINLSFCTFLLSPAAPPSPSQSTMEGVSRLARSTIRTGITFTHFLWRGKLQLHGNTSRAGNFFDGSTSDWGSRKRSFFHATAKFTRYSTRFAGKIPDKNKIQTENVFFPYEQHDLASNPLVIQAPSCCCSKCRNYCTFFQFEDS